MYNFTFHVPTTIHFGKGQISHLAELASYGSRALLCYGGGSIKRNGIYDQALSILKDAGVQVFELAGVEPNPRIQTVRRGVELCHQNDVQMVLAIGGGLSAAGPFLFDPLQEKVSKKCFYATRGKLVPAVLGNEAGMVGAALLARDAKV